MLSEQRKEQIRKEAHEILEKFGNSLGDSKIVFEESNLTSVREESSEKGCDSEFRERMFFNAPNKNEDFILAEKASW